MFTPVEDAESTLLLFPSVETERFGFAPVARVKPPVPITIVGIVTVSSYAFSVSADVGFRLASGSTTVIAVSYTHLRAHET